MDLDKAFVPIDDQVKIGACNMRIAPEKKQKEPTYQLTLDILKYNFGKPLPRTKFVEPPPHDELVSFVKHLGYTGSLELVSEMYIDHMYQPWRTFLSIINGCLSGKSSSIDRPRQSRIQILWGMIYKKNVDYAELIWEDFQFQIDSRQTSAQRREQMPYPRFTKVIINHFLSKHNTLPKRQSSFINTIKYDSVVGNLKFVNKGEEHQKYGMSISDSMMNDAIRNSTPYLTYLALSTNTKVKIPKVGKGHDPDEAVKLAESISLTEAEEQEEERHLHETHATLVIGREVNLEADKVEDKFDNLNWGSDDEGVEVLSSDDERTETDGSEKAGNEKADKEKIGDETTEEEKTRDEKAKEEKAKNEKVVKE
ncbi:hypothetical protein Tco_1373331 [Tanacetum coccineum]